MATLNSPGVAVSVIDESFYTPAASGTTPMIFVVSAEDKINPSGTISKGTEKANAGKPYLITSQRDLTDTFGTPLFYTDSSGNPLHGNELNEYGLQAAYSALGVSSRAYVVRADINLSDLAPQSSPPEGEPISGTYWVDTAATSFGIKTWNTATQRFTSVTPIVLDDSSDPSKFFAGLFGNTGILTPSNTVGQIGDFCIVTTNQNISILYYKTDTNTWVRVTNGFDGGKDLQISPHYSYPTFNINTQTGSVWITSTTPTNGAKWNIKFYNGTTEEWTTVAAPLFAGQQNATFSADPNGGGKNIPIGSLFVEYNGLDQGGEAADFIIWRRDRTGVTSIVSDPISTFAPDSTTFTFEVQETRTNQEQFTNFTTIIMTVTNATTKLGSLLPAALSANTNLQNLISNFNTNTGVLTITHKNGGDFRIRNMSTLTSALLGYSAYTPATGTGTDYLYFVENTVTSYIATNWKPVVAEFRPDAPSTDPADGTLWYNNVVDQVDIMVNSGTFWVGYSNYYPLTDANGPIIQATEPTTQSSGSQLQTGDIWIDTSDLENYGKNVYVYDTTITSGSKWVLQDTSDQSSPTGWLFADARWATNGQAIEPATITSLRTSDYVDPDAPDPRLYPRGLKLWNTRRSGFNVKKYIKGYINPLANNGQNLRFQNQSMSLYEVDRWVSQYPTAEDGSGVFGRKAQRQVIVKELKSMVDTNVVIRDTDSLNFNLIVTPGYPELIANMVQFNNDRGITAFVIGDTPMRLEPRGSTLNAYGANSAGALDNGDAGATTNDEYMAMYYPSGYTSDNSGNNIVVPPSHMMLRTFINSDAKSYQWFAPAGTRRGGVDNATNIGYLDSEGEFRSQTIPQSLRDVLDDVRINPISNLTGVGLVAYGQKTRARNASALDRVNVARLVAYLRRQLDVLSRPFLFEPNDAQTRREIKAAAESLMLELVGQRALYDFIVVCDETNNTPARIDRNELYMDIAVEPVKAVEFIYIPLRIKNRGDIEAGL